MLVGCGIVAGSCGVYHTLEVAQEGLLVEGSALETERSDNVVDLDLLVGQVVASLLSRSVGTNV